MILIASPTPALRARWRQGLHTAAAIHEVGDRATLERSLTALRPAVLIIDLAMPDVTTSEDLHAVLQLNAVTKAIVMTEAPTEAEGVAVLRAGARGYCQRDLDATLLRKAVDVVQKGELWAGRTLTSQLLEELTARVEERERDMAARVTVRLQRLTRREREIALLVGGGASNKEIGNKLGVTERTVKAHLTAIFRKLGVTDRLRLALLVNDHEPMTPSP
jgi:DNA-binding NarL/FixJ family response regulator